MNSISVPTSQKEELLDITQRVNEIVRQALCDEGMCVVYCPHTTAGLTLNECADPAVALDMRHALGALVADDVAWRHLEGNSPAHVKASLVGSSVTIPVVDGRLKLGRWQGVLLCEFDGARTREVWVQVCS